MPRRFVILHHTGHGREHWDLMLENEGVLWTWQLLASPLESQDAAVEAVRIGDHRMHYLDHEGPVSRGRGKVRRVDRGIIRDMVAEPETVRLELEGDALRGAFRLRRVEGECWTWSVAASAS